MTGVTHALIVKVAHLAGEGFAQRTETARGIERFVLDAIEGEVLQAFQRQHRGHRAFVNRLAGMAILVDEAVHAPGQVVLEGVGRKGRQCADAHLDLVERIKALRQVMRHDADEAGRESALRHEGSAGAFCHRHDGLGGSDVLGEVEVVAADILRRRRDADGEVIGQRVDHCVVPLDGGFQCAGVAGVDHGGVDTELGQFVQRGF